MAKKKNKGGRPIGKKTRLKAEAFIRAWQKAESLADVADAAGVSLHGASARAGFYRKKGIQMRRFYGRGSGGAPLNVPALAKLAKECAK